MAFPVVEQILDSHTDPNNANHDVDLAFTTINEGDLKIVIVSYDGENAITWPAGWTEITNAAGLDGTGDGRTEARYRVHQAGDPNSITLSSTSDVWCSWSIRITGHNAAVTAPECQASTGSSGNVDPPSLTPSWGAKDTLWMVYANIQTGDGTVTGWPSGYTDDQVGDNSGSGSGGVTHGFASKGANASSDDPSAFTNTSGGWRGLTIAVEPSDAGGGGSGPSFRVTPLRPRITVPGLAR